MLLVRAPQATQAQAVASKVLQERVRNIQSVVIQEAVTPASLPRGPSKFELRVWALLRKRDVHVFTYHRAKTATEVLLPCLPLLKWE